jgi:DNA-directed RNA polymerase subunit L
MIPLHGVVSSKFDISKYKFVINKKNTTNNKIYVTSEDFEVYEKNDQDQWVLNKEKGQSFFKPNKISKDYILICSLKENISSEVEELHLECVPSISNGLENIHYSPVCKCVLFNRINDSIYQQKLKELTEGKEPSEVEDIVKNFDCLEAERCFLKDQDGEPFEFTMSIESIGTLSNNDIFLGSLKLLIEKIELFNSNIQDNKLKMSFSNEVDFKAIDIVIPNENHTLGNIFQTYLYKYFMLSDRRLSFVGYDKVHPLEHHIILRISSLDKDKDLSACISEIKECIQETSVNLIKILTVIEKEWKLQYKSKKISLKKK